jgi:hypothetical protein
MSRSNRRASNRNGDKRAINAIARQLARLTDEDVYALTYSADRSVRREAMSVAHNRAEQYALNH